MQIFVELEAFDTIVKEEDIKHIRGIFGNQLQRIISSGKMVANGCFIEKRGGYLILNVDSEKKLWTFLDTYWSISI